MNTLFNDLKSGKKVEINSFSQWDYADNPKELAELLGEIKVFVSLENLKRKYFENDKDSRTVLDIFIKRGNKEISFTFGCSLYGTELFNPLVNDPYGSLIFQHKQYFSYNEYTSALNREREKFINSLLYSILCSCKNDYYIPIDFDEFCLEFGYSNDSIQAEKTWKNCLKQATKIQKIFSENEIEYLPN